MDTDNVDVEPTERIRSIRRSIDNQVERIEQHNLQDLRSRYEQVSKRESELSSLLSQEKAISKMQQLEIDRRQQQVKESTEMIRRLQEELEESRRKARSMSRELHETEMKARTDAEIINLKAKITGLEARLKRKQIDLESARAEAEELRTKLRAKEDETSQLTRKQSTSDDSAHNREYLDKINQKIGLLEAKNESFQRHESELKREMDTLKAENQELNMKLKHNECEKENLQYQMDNLKRQLKESEGSSSHVYSHLTDEVEKVKQQKATLRVEHVQLKRKYTELEMETNKLREQIASSESFLKEVEELQRKIATIRSEKEQLQIENEKLKELLEKSEKEHKNQLEELQRNLRENEACADAQRKHLDSELESQRKKFNEMKLTLVDLDNQCEKLMAKLRTVDMERKSAQTEKELLKKEIEELRSQFTDKLKLQSETLTLKEANKSLKEKIIYLEHELKEANNDHRKELSKLSDHLTKVRVGTPQAAQESCETIDKGLESQMRQQESQIRSLERQLEQSKKEFDGKLAEMEELRKRELDIINENTLLRQNFAECLKKAETFRDQLKALGEENGQLKSEVEKSKEKFTSLEDQFSELRAEIEQKEKLVAYLQSVVQPKQMQKLPRPRASLLSSESDFTSDYEMEYNHCKNLEQRKMELKMDLERKRKILAEKQNQPADESVPLMKENQPLTLSPTKTATATLKHSCTDTTMSTARTPGKMRHDIPHRWKRQFITIISNCCPVCMEGLPYFRHVFRCRDCSMTVHQYCKNSVVNTCGLPAECADFYLDTHSTSSEQMTGWVKIWSPSSATCHSEKWTNAWACIDEQRLSFYESDQAAMSEGGTPFISVDLDKEQWRIYNQTAEKPLDGVRGEDMPVLIELRMPNCTLFMKTPTVQAKQRWVQALQCATNRRIFKRRSSKAIVGNQLLLALEAPQNLCINCTQILGNEWLLIGTEEGMFVTSMQQQQLRAPFQIAGITKLCWMELVPEFDMLLTICGTNRRLMVVHLQQLYRAFRLEQQPPCIHLTSISNIEQCHIAVLSKPEHSREKRYVYLATIDSIIILQYVAKLGMFSPVKQFKTEEPCMCICSAPNGFIYGADNFHFVNFDSDFSNTSQLMVDNCPFDFPVAAVEISDNEFLLAFHNFGLFVDSQGKRTRNKNVEWEKVPLEFVYTAPYLYIVYCEFLEVVRVAPQIGLESGTLTDDRNMFKCRSAHRTGMGLSPQEVLFVVSSDDRVELHSFMSSDSDDDQQQALKSILKRKINETGTRSGIKKKH